MLEAYRDDATWVRALIDGGESERVEFKSSPKSDLREAICALANDLSGSGKPGFLCVGITDDKWNARLRIDDGLLASLAQMRSDGNLQPLPSLDVRSLEFDGEAFALIVVRATDDPPMRYRGRVWVRVGTTTQVASPQDERVLVERRTSSSLPFDHRPVNETSLSDIDHDYFDEEYLPAAYAPEVLEMNGRSRAEQLEALRFVAQTTPTVAGILVLGKQPRRSLPGAYAQFVVFAGCDLTSDVADQKMLEGRLDAIAQQLIELARLIVAVPLHLRSGDRDRKTPRYPLAALQEFIVNALLHRTYEGTNAPTRVYAFEDRVEVWSPGGPYGIVSKTTFGQPGVTDYRNPVLADALHVLGFAQRFGFGIAAARSALSENGNPVPVFQIDQSFVNVIVRAAG